jgi:hypothetical protein
MVLLFKRECKGVELNKQKVLIINDFLFNLKQKRFIWQDEFIYKCALGLQFAKSPILVYICGVRRVIVP